MCNYRNWVMALGIALLIPTVTQAGLFDVFMKKKETTKPDTSSAEYNQQVANQIAGKLRASQLKGDNIEIEYQDGIATLKGQVPNATQKANAGRIIQSVKGVKRVNNRLTLVPQKQPQRKVQQTAASEPAPFPAPFASPTARPLTTPKSNQQVAEQIAGALSSAGLKGYNLEIRYRDGNAILKGNVGSPSQKARATSVVSAVSGVKNVENNLTVTGAAPQRQVAQQRMLQQRFQQRQPLQQQYRQAAFQPQPAPPVSGGPQVGPPAGVRPPGGMGPGSMAPPQMGPPPMAGHPGAGAPHTMYNQPNLPESAWPAYSPYPNYAQVAYPKQHSASAWPYIGPFYPYPQVPLGWRQVQLEWDDGYWNLNFRPRTDKWWWFLHPKNW